MAPPAEQTSLPKVTPPPLTPPPPIIQLITRPKTFDIGNDRRLFRPFTIPSTNRKRSEGATISVEVVHGLHDTIWFSSTCTVRYRSKSLQEKSGKINRALEMMSHCCHRLLLKKYRSRANQARSKSAAQQLVNRLNQGIWGGYRYVLALYLNVAIWLSVGFE